MPRKRKLKEHEREILWLVWRHGGETTERVLAEEMKMERGWARVYLTRLGKADLLDVDRAGRVKLRWKGRHELGVPEPRPAIPKPTKTGKSVFTPDEGGSETIRAIRTLWRRR